MKDNLLSVHNVFWKIVIAAIIIIFIQASEILPIEAETAINKTLPNDSGTQKTDNGSKPQKINLNLTDVFQIEMFSITEIEPNGETVTKFVSLSDYPSSQSGTMSGIVCIGTYNGKKIATVISPLRGGEFLSKHPLKAMGTIYEVSSSEMINAVKTELEKEKKLKEISKDLDTSYYIVIDDEYIMKETEKRLKEDLKKMSTKKTTTFSGVWIIRIIIGLFTLAGIIAWRKNK